MITKKDLINNSFSSKPILEQKENKTSDFVDMVSMLLHSRTQVHTLHLQTKSYAEHIALNEYYDGIGDIVDGIIESYQGKYDIITGYKTYDLINYKNTEATIKYLKGLDDNIQKLRECCKDTYIQNQIDNVNELINSTLYKLRFLK
jgi:hypothetical protein